MFSRRRCIKLCCKWKNTERKNGIVLAIDWQIGLVAIIMLILLTVITDYVAVGSILLYLIVPILAYYTGIYSNIVTGCAIVLLIVGLIKHWINVQRIMNGKETGLRSVFKKNKMI